MDRCLGGVLKIADRMNIHPYGLAFKTLGAYTTAHLYAVGKCPTLLAQIKKNEVTYQDILYINAAMIFVDKCENVVLKEK